MILVTGATGTVGSAVVRHLIAAGQPVRVFTRNEGKIANLAGRVEVAVGDLTKSGTLPPAMRGVDRVFLLTAATQQDVDVIAAARSQGVRHIVKLSTQEAGWTPVEGHGHWHREREQLIEASGLAWTFLRPTMFMTAAMQWIATIKAEGAVYFPGGDGRLAPIDPDDVGAVAAAALMSDAYLNQGYELTGPELLTFGEMVDILAHVIGTPLRYVDVPESVVRDQFMKMGLPEYTANGLAETFRLIRAGRFAYRTEAVERIIGRPPRTFGLWCREHNAIFR